MARLRFTGPLLDDSVVSRAETLRYLSLDEQGALITYHCRQARTCDYGHPEERVRARLYAWLVLDRGYNPWDIAVEVRVPKKGDERADIVLYNARRPYLVVEAKRENCSSSEWEEGLRQGFGYAASLRARYLLVDDGHTSVLIDVDNCPSPDDIEEYVLGDRRSLPKAFGTAVRLRLVAGSTQDVRPVDARTLSARIRQAHGRIWAGGRRDPLTAFDEWSKLMFAKVWDERFTPNGDPRQFQAGVGEPPTDVARRIRQCYREAIRQDPTIFADPEIHLPDETIWQVVQLVQDIGFTMCEVDALGTAFESFFGEIFRGQLGQYFTRREICRFVCALLAPTHKDFVLDPTAGSGGFLLEALLQVWRRIDTSFVGRPDIERLKIEFAQKHVYAIEIHEVVGRICKTNLLLHKDGHLNVEVGHSCLDRHFSVAGLDLGRFTVVMGNPPFGDEVREGDRDRLGDASLSDFAVARGRSRISSEIVILERAIDFLAPGGRLGMVVPDGLLNNASEASGCPAARRLILKRTKVLAVVSLPDYAFRKAGAQNKTSLIFLQKFTDEEHARFQEAYNRCLLDTSSSHILPEDAAIHAGLAALNYPVFFAEAEHIGYLPAGQRSPRNDLYSLTDDGHICEDDPGTVLGQWRVFLRNPSSFAGSDTPRTACASIVDIFQAHPSRRLDAKYHLFRLRSLTHAGRTTMARLGEILVRRREVVRPWQEPEQEFVTIELGQDGTLRRREAGKGINPPAWQGSYFRPGTVWYRVHAGDVLFSRIDLWRGCITVVPEEYDGAIVTQEFPVYQVREEWRSRIDPDYLTILLRSNTFRAALRAITTGHSNRRRTQPVDFESLMVPVPPLEQQRAIAQQVRVARQELDEAKQKLERALADAEASIFEGIAAIERKEQEF